MSSVKPGDVLHCEVCGLTLIVDEDCGCAIAELVCCDEPMMNKGPKPPQKAATPKKKTQEKTAKVAAKPAVKPAAKKPAAKKPETRKPEAKKTPAKKNPAKK